MSNTGKSKNTNGLRALSREILESALFKRKKLTRKGLPKYVEDVLLICTPEHLPATMNALQKLVKEGNLKAIDIVLRMHNLLQAPGGINVTTNIQQLAAGLGSGPGEAFSYEATVRRLEELRRPKTIEASAEPIAREG